MPELLTSRGAITAWSPRSGARMLAAPTAETVAEHFAALCKRYARAWAEQLIGPWKKEFERRGAPHVHLVYDPAHGLHVRN